MMRNPKSENPKSERNPKPEIRNRALTARAEARSPRLQAAKAGLWPKAAIPAPRAIPAFRRLKAGTPYPDPYAVVFPRREPFRISAFGFRISFGFRPLGFRIFPHRMNQTSVDITICMGSSCFSRGNNRNIEVIQSFLSSRHLPGNAELAGHLCEGTLQIRPERPRSTGRNSTRWTPSPSSACSIIICPTPIHGLPESHLHGKSASARTATSASRHCPVKAIKIEKRLRFGHARVVHPLRGSGVEVCPQRR